MGVCDRVDRELTSRHRSWAWLAREIGVTDQVTTNWKKRGIPAARHADVARALGWSVDQLLGLEAAPATELAAREPEANYTISQSDWMLLQEFKDSSEDDQAFVRAEVHRRHEAYAKVRKELLAKMGLGGAPAPGGEMLPASPRDRVWVDVEHAEPKTPGPPPKPRHEEMRPPHKKPPRRP